MKSNILKGKLFKLALILSLIFLNTCVNYAQIRTRTAQDAAQAQANKEWFNSTSDNNYQFQLPYPKLTAIPPLSTGMPTDILLAYIYSDSLMRSITFKNFMINYYNYWDKQGTKNDTIIGFLKYLYKIIDYNPISYLQYFHNQGSAYTLQLNHLTGSMYRLLDKIVSNKPNGEAMIDLSLAHYFLRIKVISIDSIPWVKHNDGYYIYNVHAAVLDTLKGHVFKNNNCNYPQNINSKNSNNQVLDANPCISFTYATGPYHNSHIKIDNSLLNSSNNLELHPGDDLIVSLAGYDYLWDYNYDYIDFELLKIMPVINGQVSDVNYEWSNSLLLNYPDWKNAFQQKVDMLLNGGY